MAKPWDDTIKRLIALNPAAFLHLFLPDAEFIEALPTKLQQEESEMDTLFLVEDKRDSLLTNFEVQAYYHSQMPERLLRYNIIASMQRKMPVTSGVLHLLDDTPIQPSPATWEVAGKEETHSFPYHVIELSQYTQEDIIALGEVTLLPLLPFTKDGTSREMIVRMFTLIDRDTTVDEAIKRELRSIGFTFASLLLKREQSSDASLLLKHKQSSDLDWLLRRFHSMHEMIDTPIFQILREEGLLLGARRAVIYMVERRFPDLSVLVKEQTEQMNSEEELNALLLRISLATSKEEAQAVLMDWKKNATSDDTDELE